MEPEIELELFAALCADVEAGRPLANVLRAEGLLESTWEQSRDFWMGRMSNAPEAERKTLEERYLASFHARKRLTHRPFPAASPEDSAADDDSEEPSTRRAPMGTMIMAADAVLPQEAAPAQETRLKEWAPPPSVTPPMGVIAPKPLAPPVPAPSSELTPPMGVAAPKLADIPPPKPLPLAEHTPPMGVAQPNLGDIPPPKPLPNAELTPPMGVAAPNLGDVPPARPRRTPEPTPPMRPRSDFIPDEMARSATEIVADRKTDPPPPVPSRPALPFPPQMQGAPAGSAAPTKLPAPAQSAAYRPSSGGGYPQAPQVSPTPPAPPVAPPIAPPVAPPIAPPMPFPQAAPPAPPAASGPTFGTYPSMMSLAAQAAAAPVPAPAPSSSGFSPPAKAPGPPLALGNFPSAASGPRMTLETYAAFAAEIAVKPVDVAEIRERYGLTDVAHTAEDEAWQRRFSSDRDTYVRYAKLFQHYRDWFSGRTPR